MLLHVLLHGELCVVATAEEIAWAVEEAMAGAGSPPVGRRGGDGEHTVLMWSPRRHSGIGPDWPTNGLQVSVNRTTGHGGLIWYGEEPVRGVFISDNSDPPSGDPHVVADPGAPTFHDPRSTLPLDDVRAAVEAFCREATGARPECLAWVPGHLDGHRLP